MLGLCLGSALVLKVILLDALLPLAFRVAVFLRSTFSAFDTCEQVAADVGHQDRNRLSKSICKTSEKHLAHRP